MYKKRLQTKITKNFSLEGDQKSLGHFWNGKNSPKIRWKFKLDIGSLSYRVSKKISGVMKEDIKDRHSTLIYFKSNLYARLF